MSCTRVLVCTWGVPWRWSKAKYVLEVDGQVKSVESTTTARLLVEHINPDIIVLIVLDTLAAEILNRIVTTYSELVSEVESRVRSYVKENLGLNSKTQIVVAPGIGKFSCRDVPDVRHMEFIGSMMDFYGVVLYELAAILTHLAQVSDVVELHLDLSHGLNYVPTLTYRAIRSISRVLALSRCVKLYVYNSEPYPVGIKLETPPELKIHVVERIEDVKPQLRELGVLDASKCLVSLVKKTDEAISRVRRELSEYRRKLQVSLSDDQYATADDLRACLVNSLVLGLPLLLVLAWRLLERVSQPDELLKHVYEVWRENISVERDGDCVRVVRKLSMTQMFIDYVYSWLVKRGLSPIMRELEPHMREKPAENILLSVTLGGLDMLRERVFRKVSERYNVTISNDLEELKKAISSLPDRELQENVFIPYLELAKKENKRVGSLDRRNFLAHSGLPYQIVAIKPSRDVMKSEVGYLLRIKDVNDGIITLGKPVSGHSDKVVISLVRA